MLGESVFSRCSPSLRIVESGSNFSLGFPHVIGHPDGIDARDRWTVRLELSAIIVRRCLATCSGERLCLAAKIHVLLLEECSISNPSVDVDSGQTSPENCEERHAA